MRSRMKVCAQISLLEFSLWLLLNLSFVIKFRLFTRTEHVRHVRCETIRTTVVWLLTLQMLSYNLFELRFILLLKFLELLFEHFFHLLHLLRQNCLDVTLLVLNLRCKICSIFKLIWHSLVWLRNLVILGFFDLGACICSGEWHWCLGWGALLCLWLLFGLLHFPNYFKMSVNTKEISVYGFVVDVEKTPRSRLRLEEFCKFLDGKRSETQQDVKIFCENTQRSYWKRALIIES